VQGIVRRGRKKKTTSRQSRLRPGQKVVLKKLPPGFPDGLPAGNQGAISAIVGVRIRFSGFDKYGPFELEVTELNGAKDFIYHSIFVDRKYVAAVKDKRKKQKRKRRK
jgi:hypothetical protein